MLPPSVDRQVALFSFGPEDYLEGKDGGDDGGDGKSMDDGGFGDGVFGDGVSKEGERLELSWARVRHEESLISERGGREDLPFTMLPFSTLVKSDEIFDWFQNNWIF